MPKVPKGKLTPKQAKYVEGRAEGLPGYKAAMMAYNTTSLNVANTISVENMQKPTVREAVELALANNNLTIDDIIAPTKRALAYQGDTERETIEMQLKGADRLQRLFAMTEDKNNSGGNTFNLTLNNTSNYMKK